MLLLQKSLFLCGVCLRLLVKNMKGNDNDFVDIHYAFSYYAAVQPSASTTFFFLWMFLTFHFDTKLNDWRGYCSGRDVALLDWIAHGDSPNYLVYRWWSSWCCCHSLFLCFPLSSCECVYKSLWWDVFWSSAVFVCNPVCWINTFCFKTVMFKGVRTVI